MARTIVFAVALSCIATAAHAGDKPLFAPVPAWVKPAPPIDPAKLDDSAPILLVYDNQQRLQDGEVASYTESATRAATAQVLGAIGTIQLPWQPAHGDLIIHGAEIIRGSEHIDLLKRGTGFQVLRREQQIDRSILDGVLTATMAVEGLRVGDIVHLRFSVTLNDPTLKGRMQAAAPVLVDPYRVQFARVRLLWPEASEVRWKLLSGADTTKSVTKNGYRELTLPMPVAKPAEIPEDAPLRFKPVPLFEASSFAGWDDVAKVMAPLYETTGVIDPKGPIAAETDRIVAAYKDPVDRAAAALQLVQDKIRYQLMGMDAGNYVPQTPAQTWSLRYGDCKAKTLLLLAMLDRMGITAEPVLANTRLGDLVPNRLPSAAAFDHVLVRATIGDTVLWLDGTGSGARRADIFDTPPLGYVLPLRTEASAPIAIPHRIDARAQATSVFDLDQTAGTALPASFRASITFRGAFAEQLRLGAAQASKDEIDKFAGGLLEKLLDNPTIGTRALNFDERQGTATLTATGLSYPTWSDDDGRDKLPVDRVLADFSFTPDRARPAWQSIPVRIAAPRTTDIVSRIKLPWGGVGFSIDGAPVLADTLAGVTIARKATLVGDLATIESRFASPGGEIAPADVPAERKKVALAKGRPLRIAAPADHPSFWQQVAEAKRSGRLQTMAAVFAARIADKPDDATRLTDRAWLYTRVFEWKLAIDDLTRAIAIDPDQNTYLRRSFQYLALGDKAKALADGEAALERDPSSAGAIERVATIKAETGDLAGGLAMVQERIDANGKDKNGFIVAKAEILADSGDTDAAVAVLDEALTKSPGSPALLNTRCWIRGTRNIALEAAIKDCTKAIELSDDASSVLDSRAMAYFRMGRMEDALADLNAALKVDPEQAASLYLRGIIRRATGAAKLGDLDIAGAKLMWPPIEAKYRRYGIAP